MKLCYATYTCTNTRTYNRTHTRTRNCTYNGNERIILLIALLILSSCSTNQIAEGCRCLNRGLHQSYFNKDKHVMKVEVLGTVYERGRNSGNTGTSNTDEDEDEDENVHKRIISGGGPGAKRIHIAKVILNYKGETNTGEYILIGSSVNSCGEKLSRGIWLVSMSAFPSGGGGVVGGGGGSDVHGWPDLALNSLGTYQTYGCDYNIPWVDLGEEETKFLDTRHVCDGSGMCTFCGDGSDAIMCKSIPCGGSTCDTSKTCLNNYCTCTAEWLDDTNQLDCQCMKEDSVCQ